MFRKALKGKYDLDLIYNGEVYQTLKKEAKLFDLDDEFYNSQKFETEYHLLKHLVEKFNVKLPNNSLDGVAVEYSFYVYNKRMSIDPLYENDYFGHNTIIEMAGAISRVRPDVYNKLISVYKDDPKLKIIIKKAEEDIKTYNEGVRIRRENAEVLDKYKNHFESTRGVDWVVKEREKQISGIELWTKTGDGRMHGLFNVLYQKATYEELRYAYSIMKPFRIYYTNWKEAQENQGKKQK